MPRTLQQNWPAATATSRTVDMPQRSHQGQPASKATSGDKQQQIGPIPRAFAEFPFAKSWHEIAIHAQRLYGASRVGLYGKGHESWLRFAYMGESFGVQDGNDRLTLTVDNTDCPDAIVLAVQSHFASLLSSHLQD